jgi:iron complex transport system permease protein
MKKLPVLLALAAATLLTFAIAPFLGMETVRPSAVFGDQISSLDASIFWKIRLPRVSASFLAGAGLGLCGMAFQSMFRNPLATPFTLGVSSGASLGAALYIRLGLALEIAHLPGSTIAAFLGAVITTMLIYGLTRIKGGFSTTMLLLAGVAMHFFFTGIIFLTQYISDFTQSYRIVRWLMGGLEVVGFKTVMDLLPVVMIGSLVIYYLTNELNLMMIGEEEAISRGVNVRSIKRLLFFATSLMVGAIVAITGPIGFVGMMAPHICRLLIGANHRFLTPATFLFGGVFLTLCDLLARTVIAPAELPVGVITSLLGGPFFIWLLLKNTSLRGIIH